MKSLHRFLLLVCFAWGAPVTGQSSPDPVFAKITEVQPLYRDSATRRLEVLTQIWGNVGLYHPIPSAERLRWDDVLVRAIKELRSVRSEQDFASLLNRVVFAPLHDPLVYATTRTINDSTYTYPPALTTRWLAPGIAYVSAVDRQYWVRESADGFAPRDFVTPLRRVIDSLAPQHDLKRLVIDLRSGSAETFRPGLPTTWLGMWVTNTVRGPKQISILRTTTEGMGQIQWLVSPSDSLNPIGPVISIPTVFLVNRTSYRAAVRALDAVRVARKDVAVIFEETGPIPNMGYNDFKEFYPDSILLSPFNALRLSSDGALGTVLDLVVPTVSADQIVALSDRALNARASAGPRQPFNFEDETVADDSVSGGPLSPEQRIAGLMKIWYWVAHFDAYPDDISGDWRRVPANWVPRVEAAEDNRAYYRLLLQLSSSLNDTHSGVTHPLTLGLFKGGPTIPPVVLLYVENRLAVVRVDTVDASLGIRPGDEVVAIDGNPISGIEASISPLFSNSKPGRNPLPQSLPQLLMARLGLPGPRNSTVRLTIRSAGRVHDVVLRRTRTFPSMYGQIFPDHPLFAILPGNLGYMNLGWADTKERWDSAMSALEHTRGLILDGRSINAGEAEYDFDHFASKPEPWMKRIELISSWGRDYSPTLGYWMTNPWSIPIQRPGEKKYVNPVVIMIGNFDTSHGESLAQSFRIAKRATFVGEPTNGTYGTREGVIIPGGAQFYFTTGRALYPDGGKFHGIGVIPDVAVTPTLAGLRAGKDEVYDAAVITLQRIVAGKSVKPKRTAKAAH